MDNMSLSDIAAVTRGNDNDGWGQGGAWWIIILFLFVFMGGNGLWGNRTGEYGQYATAASQQEILYGQQFGQLNDRLTNVGNGICNLGYEMQGSIGQLGKEVALAQAGTNTTILQTGNGIQAQLAQCCCSFSSFFRASSISLASLASSRIWALASRCSSFSSCFFWAYSKAR